MDIKKDILWRVYLSFIFVVLVAAAIIGKGFYIQQVQGKYWRSMSDSLHQRIADIDSERGTIYSEDGQMLSTSVPQFDIYMDFRVEPLHVNNGIYLESISIHLVTIWQIYLKINLQKTISRCLHRRIKTTKVTFYLKRKSHLEIIKKFKPSRYLNWAVIKVA